MCSLRVSQREKTHVAGAPLCCLFVKQCQSFCHCSELRVCVFVRVWEMRDRRWIRLTFKGSMLGAA